MSSASERSVMFGVAGGIGWRRRWGAVGKGMSVMIDVGGWSGLAVMALRDGQGGLIFRMQTRCNAYA